MSHAPYPHPPFTNVTRHSKNLLQQMFSLRHDSDSNSIFGTDGNETRFFDPSMGPVFSSALFHEANTNGDSALLATYTIDSEPLEPGFLTGTYGSPSAYYPPDHRWRRWIVM